MNFFFNSFFKGHTENHSVKLYKIIPPNSRLQFLPRLYLLQSFPQSTVLEFFIFIIKLRGVYGLQLFLKRM